MNMFSQKRPRDEFAGDGGPDNQTPPERKRPRPLPLRTSPTTKHATSFSQHSQFIPRSNHTLTPTESSDDDENESKPRKSRQATRPPIGLPFLQPGAEQQGGSADCDMEMVDYEPPPTGGLSPWSAGLTNGGNLMPSPIPGNLINQSLSLGGGRTATPIYSHFTRNMDPTTMAQVQTDSPRLLAPSWGTASSPHPSTAESDWWRRRRLPTPISESEDSLASPADHMTGRLQALYGDLQSKPSEGFPEYTEDNTMSDAPDHCPPRIVTSDADRSDVDPGHSQSCMEASTTQNPSFSDTHSSRGCEPPSNTMTVQPRSRSNAFGSGSGGKISFSMGYRADCDKCLRKVPGHYSHIIRS